MQSLSPRIVAVALFAVAVVVAATADALVVTDEESLAGLANALVEDSHAAMDDVLTFVDTDRVPIELRDGRTSERLEADDGAFAEALRAHVALAGERNVVQEEIDLRGDEARVHVRFAAGDERRSVNLHLRREGGEWLTERAVLR
ncbi:MAG: hypothetical protein AAF411_08680 [Myxococcota bacterium]